MEAFKQSSLTVFYFSETQDCTFFNPTEADTMSTVKQKLQAASMHTLFSLEENGHAQHVCKHSVQV